MFTNQKGMFEIVAKDVMGRIGKIETPHGKIETPALMPVINPNMEFIEPSKLVKIGAEIVITNSYIIYRNRRLREIALKKGIHKLLNVNIPVMTDSGSYQLMIYGDVEVSNKEIIEFQKRIGSDIVVPLDIPTPPDAYYETAKRDLEETIKREREAVEICNGNFLLAIPLQGSTHWDLRRYSAKKASEIGGDLYAIGGIVPLMDSYRFDDAVKAVLEAKKYLPPSKPVHLFGVGHPMVFAMFVALGCDLFDSAAYALYAKDDRYLTPYGTEKLKDLQYFPCSCKICSDYTPEELRRIDKKEREVLIAEHNLIISFEEIRRVKQAIKQNELFELVEMRIRSHPYLVKAWRIVKHYFDLLEKYDPSAKQKFFYLGIESLMRPAIKRHHKKVLNVEIEKDEIVISSDLGVRADYYLKPVFGVVPAEMLEIYPAGHAEMPDNIEREAYEMAVEALKIFIEKNKKNGKKIKIILNDDWRKYLSEYEI